MFYENLDELNTPNLNNSSQLQRVNLEYVLLRELEFEDEEDEKMNFFITSVGVHQPTRTIFATGSSDTILRQL